MELNRSEALLLLKSLWLREQSETGVSVDEEDVIQRLEDFLSHESKEDARDDEIDPYEHEARAGEEVPFNEEESETVGLSQAALLDLPFLKAPPGKVRFTMDGSQLNLTFVGEEGDGTEDVELVQRSKKVLSVWDSDGNLHLYKIASWPKAWLRTIDIDTLYEVNS